MASCKIVFIFAKKLDTVTWESSRFFPCEPDSRPKKYLHPATFVVPPDALIVSSTGCLGLGKEL